MGNVLDGSFSADGNLQIVTRTLLIRLGDTVQSTPLSGDAVGAYIIPRANGGMAVQMSPFGETQQIPLPADFSGLHGIHLAPQTQVEKIASSQSSRVVAVISHDPAPDRYLLEIVDGVHFTNVAEFTLSDEPPSTVRVSGDGGTIAVGYFNGVVRLWNVRTHSELPSIYTLPALPSLSPMIGPSFLEALCLSQDGSHLFLAQADLRGQIVNRNAHGAPIVTQLPGPAGACSFDPEDTKVAVGASRSELLLGLDGKMLWMKTDVASPSSYSLFREDGKELLFVDSNGAHIRRVDSGDITLSFTSYDSTNQPDWTAWSPVGRFDGSQEGIRHLRYSSADTASSPAPIDALVRDYYTPGLVGKILAGKALPLVASVAPLFITQTVHLRQDGPPSQSVNVTVDITDTNKKGIASVRLFRNDILVSRWQSVDLANSNGLASLSRTVALLPGVNKLLAYSYDANGTKSADAVIDCQGPSTVEPGTLHVLAVGINSYKNNRHTTLKWSESDASLMAQVLSAQRSQINQEEKEMSTHPEMKYSLADRAKFARAAGPIDAISLSSDEATRENILSRIQAVVAKAKPQDTVILFFAGHGTNRNGTFYFLTSDIAEFDSNYSLDTVPITVLTKGAISDRDLESALEPLDAGSIAVIFDACESGQVLVASNDVRRGPVDAQGFAQLAFEKGISLLAAAPSSEEAREGSAALESNAEGHGWLTYELGVEGLQSGNARVSDADTSIYMDFLLRYAAQEVPKHIAQKPTIYLPDRPAKDRTLVGEGAVVLDPSSGALFQGRGNSKPTRAPMAGSAAQYSLGDLTLRTENQNPTLLTSVSLEGNQLVATLARRSGVDQIRWGGLEPTAKTLPLYWTQLTLNPQADVVELGSSGQYMGVNTEKLTTYPLPGKWKDEARIVVRGGTPIGVVQSQPSAPDASLEVWDVSKSKLLWRKPNTYLGVSAISTDGKLLALNLGSQIQLLRADDGARVWASVAVPSDAPFDSFQAVALSDDGSLLATSEFSGANPNITVFNLSAPPSDRVIWVTQPPGISTQLILYSTGTAESRKDMLAAAFGNGTIALYPWRPEGSTQHLNSGGHKISTFSVSPDGSLLVLGTTDGVVSLFDLGTSALLLRLRWVESVGVWVAQDGAGHFDAPQQLWNQLSWSQHGKLTAVQPSQYVNSLATEVLGALPAQQ